MLEIKFHVIHKLTASGSHIEMKQKLFEALTLIIY